MLTLVLRFLSVPPGDVMYHLVVLFAIEAIVLTTWRPASRQADPARRWAMGAWGLTAGRALLVLAAALASARWIPPAASILPPLERFIEIVSLGLLAWAFLPAAARYPRLANAFVLGNLALAVVVYAWAAPQWFILSQNNVTFHSTGQPVLWQVWGLVLACAGLAAAGLYRRPGWATGFVAFAILAVGHVLQLVNADPQLYGTEWTRLAALVSYPLFAAAVISQLQSLDLRAPSASATELMSSTPAPDLWPIAEAARAIVEGNAPQRAIGACVENIARAARADLVALGVPGASPDTVELAGIYHAESNALHAPAPQPSLPLASWPALQQSIARKMATRVPIDQAIPLTTALGGGAPRPLLIQPLIHQRETLGVLVIGQTGLGLSPGHPSGVDDAQTQSLMRAVQTIADHLAFALSAARKTELCSRRIEELTGALREQESRHEQSNLELEAQLARARTDLQAALDQSTQAQHQAAQHQKRAAEIAALVELQTNAAANSQERAQRADAARAQAEVQVRTLGQQVEQLRRRQSELEAEVAQAADGSGVVPNEGNADGNGVAHDQVIASLTQELRTPMTSISGYTDLLLGETSGILGAMQRQFLHRVKANIERMSGMLNDLIRITAIDTRNLRLEPEPINLVKVMQDAIAGSAAQFRERAISVQLDLAENLPHVHADRDSLYQIASHLLANACLCSQPGTHVVVAAKRTDDNQYLSVSITDTGGGISPVDQLRVFTRRYRADNPLIEGLGDTGVGLSIARTLVEAHGGRIWVRSDMGHGSTFTFVLHTNNEHGTHSVEASD